MQDHSHLSWQELGRAAQRAQKILDSLENGVQDLTRADVQWLYSFTGFPKYTKSVKYMCGDIIRAYKVQAITLKLTRQI